MAGDDDGKHTDPDRAAILARRRRFIAIAISGLASTGCKPTSPEVCLSIQSPDAEGGAEPEEEATPGSTPIVEDPGAPIEFENGEPEEPELVAPEVCLKITVKPQPCLEKAPPQPCLLIL